MKVSTSELAGPALDWAVAKCEWDVLAALNIQYPQYAQHFPKISPSTDWAQGGPIIEREEIHILRAYTPPEGIASIAHSSKDGKRLVGWRRLAYCHTPLIAAMRCYLASKLGDEVDVPEELT